MDDESKAIFENIDRTLKRLEKNTVWDFLKNLLLVLLIPVAAATINTYFDVRTMKTNNGGMTEEKVKTTLKLIDHNFDILNKKKEDNLINIRETYEDSKK